MGRWERWRGLTWGCRRGALGLYGAVGEVYRGNMGLCERCRGVTL